MDITFTGGYDIHGLQILCTVTESGRLFERSLVDFFLNMNNYHLYPDNIPASTN